MLALDDQCPDEYTYDDLASTSFVDQYVRDCVVQYPTAQGAGDVLRNAMDKSPALHGFRELILETLLHQDASAVYLYLATPDDSIGAWLYKNAMHAVSHCSRVLSAWAEGGFSHLYMASHKMTQALALVHSDEEKKAFLQGDTSTAAGKIVARLLRGAESPPNGGWSQFSPSWIGQPGSALRQAAIEGGWVAKDAMAMVDLFILEDLPEGWIGNLAYPYTAMVCRWIQSALRFAKLAAGIALHTQAIVPLKEANPIDVVMAQLVYQASPIALRASLEIDPSARMVSNEEYAAIAAVVQTQMQCMAIHAFADSVCKGDILAARDFEAYSLDALL